MTFTLPEVAVLLTALSVLIPAVSKALARRAERAGQACARRVAQLEAVMGEYGVTTGMVDDAWKSRDDGELAALGRALRACNAPVVAGVVCSEEQYVAVVNFAEVLGHDDVEGCRWDDPRFVRPDDVAQARKGAAESTVGINRGYRTYMLTAGGVRLPGRVYSAAARTVGDRQMRFFLVVFDEGSLEP